MKKCMGFACLFLVTLLMFSLEVGAAPILYDSANLFGNQVIEDQSNALTDNGFTFQASTKDVNTIMDTSSDETEAADTEAESMDDALQTPGVVAADLIGKSETLENLRQLMTRQKAQPLHLTNDMQQTAEPIELSATIRTFGGNGNDWLQDVIMLADGGYLLVGTMEIVDYSVPMQAVRVQSAWAARFSAEGELLWDVPYRNKESNGAFSTAIEKSDGTIMLHYINSLFNMRTHSLIIISAEGEVLSELPMSSRVYNIYRTSDGLIGDSGSGLTRYDENLATLYEVVNENLQNIEFMTEDGTYFSGYTLMEGDVLGDAVVFKLDAEGGLVYELLVQENARFEKHTITQDGAFIGAGYMDNGHGMESGMGVYIEPDGTVRYMQEYPMDGQYFFLSDAMPVEEGVLFVGGSNGGNRITIILADSEGAEVQRFFIDLGSKYSLTASPIMWLATKDQLYLVGDLVYYRSLLALEDTELFLIPVNIPSIARDAE